MFTIFYREEYFIALETYIMKLVQNADAERLRKLIGVHKKIKIDNSAFEDYFWGIKKSKVILFLKSYWITMSFLSYPLYKPIFIIP